MIRDILIHVPADAGRDAGIDYGLALAREFGAHATGIAFALEAQLPPTYFGAVPGEIMVENRRQAEAAAGDAIQRFLRAAEGTGLKVETRTATTTVDGAADAFGRLARLYDVTVITQPNPDRPGPQSMLLEAALFESGRAVLIVPYVHRAAPKFGRVLVAWDGGRAATRAAAEARPLLAKAKRVEIVVVESGKIDSKAVPGADLARHLARHELKVEVRRIVAESRQQVDEMILNEVFDSSVDLVVMGGYGHSRLREFVLGGVTRGIIEAMTAPVLMAH